LPSFQGVAAAAAGPFLFAFALALALVPVCRSAAIRFKCVAHPREDRWHRRPIALFGGAAIGLTVAIGLIVFGAAARPMAVLLTCVALIFATGLADDIVSLRPSTKLVIEIAIASVFLFFGYRLNWTSSLTLDTILTLVWVVGMTNAFNLLDNMDGLCAGIALIVGAALLVGLMSAQPGTEAFFQLRYLALLLGATAGFLAYNYHPASIFMGDSGSLLLGLSFAALTLSHSYSVAAKSNPLSIVAVPLLVLLIPIFDTALVTVSRIATAFGSALVIHGYRVEAVCLAADLDAALAIDVVDAQPDEALGVLSHAHARARHCRLDAELDGDRCRGRLSGRRCSYGGGGGGCCRRRRCRGRASGRGCFCSGRCRRRGRLGAAQ